ncbi:MAG TPA: DinB family protein [Candidatus Limnocylindria bacterium]
MADPLDHVLRHNTWANVTLLDSCAALDLAALEMTATGTYGTLYGTLQHVVGAEQWYLQLLTGEVLGRSRIRRGERHSLDELITTAKATGARVLAVAATDDVARRIDIDPGRASTVGVILAQLVHHGNEHRTQATTILGANGVEPPALSGWGYGRAAGISEAAE